MRKAVLISIQGTQCYEGDEPQALELMTNGFYEKQPDRCRILYEETEMTGMDGVKTVFEIFPDHVELNRAGAVESQMVFRPGERMESLYDLGSAHPLMKMEGRWTWPTILRWSTQPAASTPIISR